MLGALNIFLSGPFPDRVPAMTLPTDATTTVLGCVGNSQFAQLVAGLQATARSTLGRRLVPRGAEKWEVGGSAVVHLSSAGTAET